MFIEALISYLIGSVNFSYIVGKLKGIDLSKHWDKNLGTTNLYFALKPKVKYSFLYAILVGFLDILKGVIPALLFDPITLSFAILGHNFSLISYVFTRRFPTGCGLATSVGWMLVYSPQIFLIGIPLDVLYHIYLKNLGKKLRDEMLIHLVLLYSILFYLILFNPTKEIQYGLILIAVFTGLARVIRYKEILTQIIWKLL